MTCGIYGLFDPGSGKCRYVGQAIDVQRRFRQHTTTGFSMGPTREWIGQLRRDGAAPELRILEEVAHWSLLNEAEARWVRDFKAKDEADLNRTLTGQQSRNRNARLSQEGWLALFERAEQLQREVFQLGDSVLQASTAKNGDQLIKASHLIQKTMRQIADDITRTFPEWAEKIWAAHRGGE